MSESKVKELMKAESSPAPADLGYCATCQFLWVSDISAVTLQKEMYCRRNPPVAYPAPRGVVSFYPPTAPQQWCGEWRGK